MKVAPAGLASFQTKEKRTDAITKSAIVIVCPDTNSVPLVLIFLARKSTKLWMILAKFANDSSPKSFVTAKIGRSFATVSYAQSIT